MDFHEALEKVQAHLKESEIEMNAFGSALPGYVDPQIELVILSEYTQEHEFGWVFFYNSAKYIATGDFSEALAGNAPLIVNKFTGEIVPTGTARDAEYYVSNYQKTGDPHCEE